MGVLAPGLRMLGPLLGPPSMLVEIGLKVFLINFLAKSGNSKHFSFLSTTKINCGHYFCLPSTKIMVTMFACHLHNSSGMCLHLARTNHLSVESP